MNKFDNLKNLIDDIDKLRKLTDSETTELKSEGYPEDYLEFLSSIGYGNVGALQLYSGPISPSSVYPENAEFEGITLFGDDFQGHCYGFDRKHGMKVVTVDPRGGVDKTNLRDFGEFIRVFIQ